MTDLRALLFDVDGTLADTEELHRTSYNATFPQFSLDWHWNRTLYKDLLVVSGGISRMRHFARSVGMDDPDPALLQAIYAAKSERYQAGIAEGLLRPRPGIPELLGAARDAGLTLAVVTTTGRGNAETLLRHVFDSEAVDWFTLLTTGESVSRMKPDPEAYRVTLDALGLAPGACLAIEDSANGLRSAREAGIPVVITRIPWTDGDDFTGAAAVMDDLTDVGLDDLRRIHGSFRR